MIPDLATGQLSLILDGLDEAYVRAGIEGLESLAADVDEILGGQSEADPSHASFVVLGRSVAIEFFALVLDDRGITPERLAIGFLRGGQASELIDLEAGAGAGNQGYAETRDRLLEWIRRSIDRHPRSQAGPAFSATRRFSPPLVATYRIRSTGSRTRSQAAQGGAYWDPFMRVDQDILSREQRKVRAQLDADDRVSEEFFSPAHQIQMLLATTPSVSSKRAGTRRMKRRGVKPRRLHVRRWRAIHS